MCHLFPRQSFLLCSSFFQASQVFGRCLAGSYQFFTHPSLHVSSHNNNNNNLFLFLLLRSSFFLHNSLTHNFLPLPFINSPDLPTACPHPPPSLFLAFPRYIFPPPPRACLSFLPLYSLPLSFLLYIVFKSASPYVSHFLRFLLYSLCNCLFFIPLHSCVPLLPFLQPFSCFSASFCSFFLSFRLS